MNLAVFDIDGRLLDNQAAEDACFSTARGACLGIRTLDTSWTSYAHVSDDGITREAHAREFGREPTAEQVHRA